MWSFRRRRTDVDNNVPAEVKDYYQAERRERVGVAWVLAFTTLVVTVLLALGLFFGGRWAYRNIFNGDESGETAQTTTEEVNENTEEKETENRGDNEVLPGDGQSEDEDNEEPEDSTSPRRRPGRTTPTTGPLPTTGPSHPEL